MLIGRAGDAVAVVEERIFEIQLQDDATVNFFQNRLLTHHPGGKAVGPGIHEQAYTGFLEGAVEILTIDERPVRPIKRTAVEVEAGVPETALVDIDEKSVKMATEGFESAGLSRRELWAAE